MSGNLPTEKVTKRDLFHVFHKHGKLAQISIKQAYGFIQFLEAQACYRALQAEQGQPVRGRRLRMIPPPLFSPMCDEARCTDVCFNLDLEISKPQKNTRNATVDVGVARGSRRSRSPDYGRGGPISPRTGNGPMSGGRFNGPDRVDRGIVGRNGRDRGSFDGTLRGRDDYRPGRSPSPPPRGYRDEYRGGRDSRREADRYHRRSRSRSPYGRSGGGRYRSRTPPPRELDEDAELPLPRRAARDIPEAQIIVMDELDRYVPWSCRVLPQDRS